MKFCNFLTSAFLLAVIALGVVLSVGTAETYDGNTVVSNAGMVDDLATALPCFEATDDEAVQCKLVVFAVAADQAVVTWESDGAATGFTLASVSNQHDINVNHSSITRESDGGRQLSLRPRARLSKWPLC